ncbi:MAG: metallophosphoesterase [Hyphococcus sp.]|nr:MAG: metallophosphoesterase [Marinicaulis sp.]
MPASMFKTLFKKQPSGAQAPEGERLYAIGDVHGCADELDKLLDKIEADASGHNNTRIIFLGDYVDRGPDSKGVLDRLIALKEQRPCTIFLKGNHEALMLDFLEHPEDMMHWLDWGGQETLQSYDIRDIAGRSNKALGAALREKMPDTHIEFLNALTLTHLAGDYLFVHAGVRPDVALDDQTEEDLIWIRKRFHNTPEDKRLEQTIVHGHQPVKKPMDKGWRIDVDTGACWSGMLTAVVLEGTTRRFIST